VVTLHGAGGDAEAGFYPLLSLANDAGVVLLSPASRAATWDVIGGAFGPDVAMIDAALERAFARCNVDPRLLAIGGFSDGASYALSLGLTNGDLFQRILAFSPGFAAPAAPHGAPRIFVSHGRHDAVLPIDACSRRIVPRLRQAEYDVTYVEFDGPHTVPNEMARRAIDWYLAGETAPDRA
jgi:phospholipase/carboxylesterase